MTGMVRVVLVPKAAEAPEADDRQIVIDLAIDGDDKAVGPFPAFGRVGDFRKPETLYPFALMADGRIDYGAYAADGARQNRLEIRAVHLAAGAEVAHRGAGGDETYLILAITPLAGG